MNNIDDVYQDSESSTEKDVKKSKLLDSLIDKMGITSYTFRVCIIIFLFNVADGSEMIVISLITTELGKVWSLSHFEKGCLGSSVFVGFFLGVLISGKISDNCGRRPTFIIGSILSSIFSISSTFSANIITLISLRALFGFGIGMIQPDAISMAIEVSPSKYRVYILNSNTVFFVIGEILAITVGRNCLDFKNGWRILLGVVGIISISCSIVSVFILESPRYYLHSQQYEKAFKTLENIISFSKKGEELVLTEQMKERIKEEETADIVSSYTSLCAPKYKNLTFKVSSIFFIVSFTYYGLMYILPQILVNNEDNSLTPEQKKSRMYNSIVISSLAGIPGLFFFSFLSNTRLFGRIRSIYFGFLVSFITCIVSLFLPNFLYLLAPLLRAAIGLSFCIIYIYTSESFPTKIRSISIGFTNAFNRMGGIITPILTQLTYSIYSEGSFIMFALLAILGFITTCKLPFETLNRNIE